MKKITDKINDALREFCYTQLEGYFDIGINKYLFGSGINHGYVGDPGNINITCGSFDGSSISASDRQYGRIWVGDSWSNFCFADPDGYVGCF